MMSALAASIEVPAHAQLPTLPGRVTFDDSHLANPSNYYGYHGFTVYDVSGAPLKGSYNEWTAVVAGVNGPLTFGGRLDYYGRGVFGYWAGALQGLDTLTVSVGPAVGTATRSYGVAAPPADAIALPIRLEWDKSALSHPTKYYGYHGFTVYDANNRPVKGHFLGWNATVQGVNGPLTFSGQLSWDGRGVIGYYGKNSGVDTLTATVGTASGTATRTYGSGVPSDIPNPLPSTGLPGGDVGPPMTPLGQILVVNANVLQGGAARGAIENGYGDCAGEPQFPDDDRVAYKRKKACGMKARQTSFAQRVADLALKTGDDGMGFAPDVLTLQETWAEDAEAIARFLTARSLYPYAVANHSDYCGAYTVGTKGDSAIIYNRDAMTVRKVDCVLNEDPGPEPNKRQAWAFLRETLPTGAPPAGARSIGIASVHYTPGDEYRTSTTYNLTDIRRFKAEWFDEIYYAMVEQASADEIVLAGDFNEPRCMDDPGPAELEKDIPADFGSAYSGTTVTESVNCDLRPLHRAADMKSFQDTIFATHGHTDETLDLQYRDGLQRRNLRIDHIFAQGTDVHFKASFDVSCGMTDLNANTPEEKSCTWLGNKERYSDHRILWTLLGARAGLETTQ